MGSTHEKIVRAVYDRLGYVVDDELLDILTSDDQHKLVKAPAGGTKTTLSQMYLVLEKVNKMVGALKQNRITPMSESTSYNTENIYCCVYNSHNVTDILNIHKRMYFAFESLGLLSSDPTKDRYSSDNITASTLHSFAYKLVEENMEYFKLRTMKKAADIYLNMQLKAIVKTVLGHEVRDIAPYKELYNLYTNLMMYDTHSFDDIVFASAVSATEINPSKLQDVFELYDKQKKRTKSYEFSDWLKMAVELLEIPEIAAVYHKRFKIIVADEVQDFTKLMFAVYRRLVSNNARTLAIGDSDQTIYQFNGASPDNIDRYEELVGVKVRRFNLTVNRRCHSDTLFYATNIIRQIPDRKDIPLTTMKKGGRFEVLTYSDFSNETEQLVKELTNVPYTTSAVLYRKRLDCLPLSRKLFELGIPVSYINATPFNQHHLYYTFVNILEALFTQRTRDTWKHLFKVLPFSKEKLAEFLKFDQREMPTAFEETQDWAYLDFSPLIKTTKFSDSLWFQVTFAQGIASKVMRLATKEYIPMLFEMFWLNYYKYIADENDVFLQDVYGWVISDYSSVATLGRLIKSRDEDSHNKISFSRVHPITICTIHATKGLEFDRVILAHMEAEVQRSRVPTQATLDYEYHSDIRLYYVGATRQKSCLILSYNKNRPHRLNDPGLMTPPPKIVLEEKYMGLTTGTASRIFSQTPTAMQRKFELK